MNSKSWLDSHFFGLFFLIMVTECLVTNKNKLRTKVEFIMFSMDLSLLRICHMHFNLVWSCCFSVARSKSAIKDTQEKQADDESDQSTTFMRNTMISGTMVSGEASETDDEDDDGVTDQEKTNDSNDTLEAAGKPLKDDEELLDAEICDLEFESGTEVKTKRQKIVYKFDS